MHKLLILFVIIVVHLFANGKSITSQTTFEPYGYIKLDMSYDSNLMSIGNFARWVLPNQNITTPTTSITAKQSRFGININNGTINGKVEIDFYGIGAENKGTPMLRKAYTEAKLKKYTIRVGQDSDVFSPLVPATINYPVAWWAGNIGYRRPMLKILGDIDAFAWTVALARNIGTDLPNGECVFDCADGINDGSTAVLPEFQGRLSTTLSEKYTIGISCHYGKQKSIRVTDIIDEIVEYKSWSTNLDLNLILTNQLTLLGELFMGSNLASHLGGIANTSTLEGIDTQGGWINLKFNPNSKNHVSIGVSMEDPDDENLNNKQRSKNTMLFANLYHDILQGFLVGFEVSHWTTHYKNLGKFSATRGQLAFLYKF